MRLLKVAALCVAMTLAGTPAFAASGPPIFHGTVQEDTGPTVPAGATFYFAGDSITFGLGINNQNSQGCSAYTYPSPCFADQVTSHFNATEVNQSQSGGCLEHTTTSGSLCNPSYLGNLELIDSYTTKLLPYAGNNNNWFWIQIGTNDVSMAIYNNDTQVNVATFKSDYETIVSALESAGTPGNQIVLSEIPFNQPNAGQSNIFAIVALQESFNSAIADVAREYHTRFSLTYRAIAQCIPTGTSFLNPCLYDSAHPNNTGHANIALADEHATFENAISAKAQYVANGLLDSIPILTTPYNGSATINAVVLKTQSIMGSSGNYESGIWDVGTGASGAGGFAQWGTGTSAVAGVGGTCFLVNASAGTVDLTVDCQTGNVGFGGEGRATKALVAGYIPGSTPAYGNGDLVGMESASCGKLWLGGNSANGTLDFGCTTASQFTLNKPIHIASTQNAGQLSCSLSSATSCTATATVPSGAICTATYDGTDAGFGAALAPILTGVSTTTLTITARMSSAQTGTVYLNYVCL